jgi:hypothetical protein
VAETLRQLARITPEREVIAVVGYMRIRRTHGILGGFVVAVLGVWGAIVPFIGPYFHYAFTPDKAWTYNTGRLYLEILPGAGALLGGLIMMAARSRHAALFGALLGIASGAWFIVGNTFAPLWTTLNPAGVPASLGQHMRILEQIGFFGGTGAVIVMFAALVAGRITAVPSVARADRAADVPATRDPVDDDSDTTVIETR